MAGLYGSADGVNRLPKKWIIPVGGINRELKELHSRAGGANRKVFSSAIKWTYTVGYDHDAMIPHVGPSTDNSPITWQLSANGGETKTGQISFVFNDLVHLPAAEALYYSFTTTYVNYNKFQIYINDVLVLIKTNPGSGYLTLSADTDVAKISVQYSTARTVPATAAAAITLYPKDHSSFKLSSDGEAQ